MENSPEPGSHRASGLKLTRRSFLGGAAAIPAGTIGGGWIFAAGLDDVDDGADLVLLIANDERSVTVRRVPHPPANNTADDKATEVAKPAPHVDWVIQADSFGPRAWFDMSVNEYAADASHRYLVVRNVSYGRHDRSVKGRPLYLRLDFQRVLAPDERPKAPANSSVHVWTVGLTTNVWPGDGASEAFSTEAENRKAIYKFVDTSKKERLVEMLSVTRMNSALGPMFDTHLQADELMYVGLDADMRWHLQAVKTKTRPLSAFEKKVRCPSNDGVMTVEWRDLANGGDGGSGRRLVAECDADWMSPLTFEAVDQTIFGIVEPIFLDATAEPGALFVGQLEPLSSAITQGGQATDAIVALLSWPQAALTCSPASKNYGFAGAGAVKAGKAPPNSCVALPLHDLKLSRVRIGQPKDSIWRQVIVADAAGSRGANPAKPSDETKPTPVEAAGAKKEPAVVALATAIGRLDIKALPVDVKPAEMQGAEDKDEMERRLFDAAAAAAIGDRSGVSDRTFFLLADSQPATAKKNLPQLRRLYADVALSGADTALAGTTDSVLVFLDSHFRLLYADGQRIPKLVTPEAAWNSPSGFLWLGKAALGSEAAAIDLGRAKLLARRDRDLVDLRFRFADFALAFGAGEDGLVGRTPPMLRPARKDCAASLVDGHFNDNRPILSVEFSPQHVMEEAFFRPDPEPLPDTPWPSNTGFTDLGAFLTALGAEADAVKREQMRKDIGDAKVLLEQTEWEKGNFTPRAVEKPFAELRLKLKSSSVAPDEQKEYFGPYAMSPDAIRFARNWQADTTLAWLNGDTGLINGMLTEAGKVGPQPGTAVWAKPELLVAEADAEKAYPLYKLWRDAFRAYVIEFRPELEAEKQEFINARRIPAPDAALLPEPGVVKAFVEIFAGTISGQDRFDRLSMARLSAPSRLSFRVNCEPAPSDNTEADGLPAFSADNAMQPGPGVQRFGSMVFSLEELTNWSHHEPYVTQRARKLYQPLASGALLPVSGRVASIDDHAILESQDFTRGAKGAEAHLLQARASLQKHPSGLETGIELPARLILSTAQDAVWQTTRKVSRGKLAGAQSDVFETDPEDGVAGANFASYEPLWTARLLAQEVQPSLRAVWSPDLRPEAVGFVSSNTDGVPRIAGAPPRGPWAPWVLRREQVDGVRVVPDKVAEASGLPAGSDTNGTVCTIMPKRPTMFERICEIFRLRVSYGTADLHMFRTSLDAYDRHELVLLSSAYGLPVTGRRLQIGDDENKSGELMERSGQFEPGEDFHIIDGNADLAYYRPKPLDVTELSLTALGGFLTHDTNFLPPAPALTYDGRPMFDGLSIERWQHQVVLGRDILATVVYSGYLLPLGHKASLVKLTERIFVRMNENPANQVGLGIKAILRQRMFVRVSSPLKKYPAVGQPNHGRQWCAEDVTMLTRQTPDIVDPTFELETTLEKQSLSGRIHLDGAPGLAFWPQTAMTEEARVRFEFLIDGRRTRMPLIFADRIAAKHPKALAALINYYSNTDRAKWRTAALGGQTLRFADPVKDGDTSFATESLVLSIEGRKTEDASWSGENTLVDNTGVLEGADQPPFYPVMQSAKIRIEQAERMSGSSMGAAKVRFDGHYVKHGFPKAASDAAVTDQAPSETGNAAELFLYVDSATPPELRMGPNGSQSGGIGRPDMRIVGLSRSKGTIGARGGVAIYKRTPTSDTIVYPATENGPALLSIAEFFSLPPRAESGATRSITEAAPEPANYTAVFDSFFNADAKLLGVISFQSLMKLLKLVGGVDAMPVLQEAVDYGSQALARLEGGAADVMDLLRSEVLFPLLTVVREARAEWSNLDVLAAKGQKSVIEEISQVFKGLQAQSFRDLYPEIDRGLNALETTIGRAAAETDPLKMMGRLAAVHEAGRQFMRELSRLAANPVERLEQAARTQFNTAAKDLREHIDSYEAKAKAVADALKNALQNQAKAVGDRLVSYVFDWLDDNDISLLLTLMSAASSPEDVTLLAGRVRDGLLKIDVDLSSIVSRLIKDTKPNPVDVLAEACEAIIVAADKAAADTAASELQDKFLDNAAVTLAKAQLRLAIESYRKSLASADGKVKNWLANIDSAPQQWRVWITRVKRIERLAALLQELAATDNPSRAFSLLTELGRDYLGVDLAVQKKLIEDRLKAEQQTLINWLDPVRRRLQELGQDVANATDINPKLPAGVFEACLAGTPFASATPADAETAARAVTTSFSAVPDHWLAPFAAGMAETFDIALSLDKIIDTTEPLPTSVKKTASALKMQLPKYRELFCETVIMVGHAEHAHADVVKAWNDMSAGGDVTAVLRRVLETLRTLSKDVAAGLSRMQALFAEIAAALAPHAPFIAGAFASALAAKVILESEKDTLDEWHAAAAKGLLTAMNTLLRVAGVAAGLTSPAGNIALSALAKAVQEILPADFDPERNDFSQALVGLTGPIAALADRVGALRLDPALKPTTIKDLLDAKLGLSTIREALTENGIAQTKTIQDAFNNVAVTYDKLLTRFLKLPRQVADAGIDAVVKTLLAAVSAAYTAINDLRAELLERTKSFAVAGPAIRNALLVPPLRTACVPLAEGCDKLTEERADVDKLLTTAKPVSELSSALQAYSASVAGGRSATETIVRNFQGLWDTITRGDVASLVDIAALRDEVEEHVSQLIPVKRTLRYSLGYDFDPGKVRNLTGGIFQPKVPGRFELDMTATIDLMKQKAEMKAVGHIGAFDISLIGTIFDAVTLIFDGIDFSYEAGGSPRFDVHYRDFKIGKKLEFIQQLQSYLSPSKDGSGFFIEASRDRPGITAGYGLNLGTIQLGGVAFSNVLLAAAAELPFDGGAAIFRFSLGRAMAPFLISVPPFGGGGFVAIYADADGFVGFEASMEFGGVADFSAGPLVAVGRLTSGFYIRSMTVVVNDKKRTLTDIHGTFFVGGSASIWIFDFYASLYVRLGMKAGGEMEGIAIFTFSFSMGIVDYDFSVTVKKNQKALGQGASNSISYDDIPDNVDTSIITRSSRTEVPNVVAETVSLSAKTASSFLDYFDLSLASAEPKK